ncbi:XRE family transcriptional regulator (plasmid) [Streptomyces sp. NBC_01102]|uniref:telomere-protecting terminal protein Tpg n=1 Tax=Streptomyces sp. NBC_01102 TaxID=2903749 RepID=UPI002F911BEC|nr:XRE family transcriptional regulator [Streptomyces sp. NBC_01102]
MREIENAIERAEREAFTREPPKTLKAQINYLIKQLGTAKAVAQELGITADSVNRYRRGARKNPPKNIAKKIDGAVRSRWQPQVRRRRRKQAASSGGITVETRASFGYKAAGGSTDEPRMRRLTVHLPATYAQRLFDARDRGDNDQKLREIIADGFREVYFQDGGRRAGDLHQVEMKNIDYLDLDY